MSPHARQLTQFLLSISFLTCVVYFLVENFSVKMLNEQERKQVKNVDFASIEWTETSNVSAAVNTTWECVPQHFGGRKDVDFASIEWTETSKLIAAVNTTKWAERVLITGGMGNIGYVIAERLHDAGVYTVVVDIEDKRETLGTSFYDQFYNVDMLLPGAIEKIVKSLQITGI